MSKYGKSSHGNTGREFYFFAVHLLRLLLFFPSKSRSWKWLSRFNFEGARIPKSAAHTPTAGVFHHLASLRHRSIPLPSAYFVLHCKEGRGNAAANQTPVNRIFSFPASYRRAPKFPPQWMPLSIAERTLLRISLGIKHPLLIEMFRLLGRPRQHRPPK